MDPIIVIITIIVALLGGLALGWFFASKARSSEIRAGIETLDSIRLARDGLKEDLAKAESECTSLRDAKSRLEADLSGITATTAEREKAHEEKLRELKAFNDQVGKQMTDHFSNVSNKLLSEAQKQFLERADQRFSESEKSSEEKIRAILAPVGEKLKLYEQKVELIEQDRKKGFWRY